MTMPKDATAFPKFPTLFNEADAKRLADLEEQRKQMETIFQGKFTTEAWEGVSAPEKLARTIAPTWLTPVARLAPWQWGLDLGFTPEQARARREEVEVEYKELVRKQRVSRIAPIIQDTLRMLALTPEGLPPIEDLGRTFKMEEMGFSEEEIGSITNFARKVANASPEAIASGAVFNLEPITKEQEQDLFRSAIEPRQVLTTVAFSKNQEDIAAYLKGMYAPKEVTGKEKIITEFTEKALGVTKESSAEQFRKMAEEQGLSIVLTDEQTGIMTPASKRSDNTVWVGEDLIGYFDENTGGIVSFGLDGEPLLTETNLADKLKVVGNRLFLGGHTLLHSSRQFITSILPQMIFSNSGVSLEEQVKEGWITEEQAEEMKVKKDWRPWASEIDKFNEQVSKVFIANYQINEEQDRLWLEEHPELIPPAEWEGRVIDIARETPRVLLDPLYWAYIASQSAIYTGAFLAASLSVGYITKSPTVGLAAGVAATTPFETKQLYDELSIYTSPEQAAELSVLVGATISSIELVGGMPVLKAVLPSVFRGLKKEIVGEVVKQTFIGIALKGLKTFTTIEFMETLEEVLQESVHNAILKWFNRSKEMFKDIPEIIARTVMSAAPFGFLGSGANIYYDVKKNLSLKTQEQIDTTAKKMEDAGLSKEHAEAVAVAKIMETEKGRAEIEIAQEKAESEVTPVTPGIAEPIIVKDISKMSLPEVQNELRILDERMERALKVGTLESIAAHSVIAQNRVVLVAQLKKLGGVPPRVTPVTPEVTKDMVSHLKSMGYPDIEISKMTPQKAQDILERARVVGEERLREITARGVYPEYVWNPRNSDDIVLGEKWYRANPEVPQATQGVIRPKNLPQVAIPKAEVGVTPTEQPTLAPTAIVEPVVIAPTTTLTSEKIAKLGNKIDAINEELKTFQDSIKLQEDRLTKITLPYEKVELLNTINGMKDTVTELESKKARLIKNLQKMKKATEPPIAPVVEEVIPTMEVTELVSPVELTIEGVANKIMIGETLTPEEEQFRVNNSQAIENTLLGREEFIAGRRAAQVEAPLSRLIERVPSLKLYSEEAPGLPSLEIELEEVRAIHEAHPEIEKITGTNVKMLEYRCKAELAFNDLHSRYDGATEEEQGLIGKEFTKLAKESGIDETTLYTKHWNDLTPPEKRDMVIAQIPNGSLPFMGHWEFQDTILTMIEMGELTGYPLQYVAERAKTGSGYVQRLVEADANSLDKNPQFRHIIRDKKLLKRIGQELNSRDEGSGISPVEDLTDDERALVDNFEDNYRQWQPIVRTGRFEIAYKQNPTVEGIIEAMPDAKGEEVDVALAIGIYEKYGEDALWRFLQDKTWGVIDSGYEPRQVHNPKLSLKSVVLNVVRGRGHLLPRESPTYPVEQKMELVLARRNSYNYGMGVWWFLRKEIDSYAEFFEKTKDKWENSPEVEKYLKNHVRSLMGYPVEGNAFDMAVRRVRRWSSPIVFSKPILALRNLLQIFVTFPFRTAVVRSLFTYRHLPASLRARLAIRFATNVNQFKAVRTWQFQDPELANPGKASPWLTKILTPLHLVGKGMDFVSSFIAKYFQLQGWTDVASRMSGYTATAEKASIATNQYNKDKDIKAWIKNSGAYYLTKQEQRYILELFFKDKQDWGIYGLQNTPGQQAAIIKLAETITERSLYLYDMAFGKGVLRTPSGRSFGSLFIFPASVVQQTAIQVGKVFSPESTTQERLAAGRNLFLALIFGDLVSSFLMTVTGRREKEYMFINMLTWELGGLSLSILQDMMNLFNTVVTAAAGTEEDKKFAWTKFVAEVPRLASVFIPAYVAFIDSLETITDEPTGLDRAWLRKIRAYFDENYTPEEREKIDRTFWEGFNKIVWGTETPDPDILDQALKDLAIERERLGEIQVDGSVFKTTQLGGRIQTIIKSLPKSFLSKENDFSELDLFYADSKDAWEEYFLLPSEPASIRDEWRLSHPEEEAMMIFWGKVDGSVSRENSPEQIEIYDLLFNIWNNQYGLSPRMLPYYKE